MLKSNRRFGTFVLAAAVLLLVFPVGTASTDAFTSCSGPVLKIHGKKVWVVNYKV